MNHLYRMSFDDPRSVDPVKMTIWCRNELLLLSFLEPMVLSDPRADFDPCVYTSDISPVGLGVTSA